MHYFLGIDVGTYSSKGVLTDESGKVVSRAVTHHGMENPEPGYYEQDADKVWWNDFCILSKMLLQQSGVEPEKIACVGGSTLGADCLPVDKDGHPLRKAILYGIDARCVEEMEYLSQYYGTEKVKKLFGRPICSGDVSAKILWIKNHEPEVYRRTHKFLTGSSYLTFKLTGKYVIDTFLGMASFRPLYYPDGSIHKEMCKPICMPEQLAEGMPVTHICGTVTKQAAKETGLKEGTPVITGTGDSAAEAISVGVLAPGDLMVQFGSSLFFYCCADRLIQDERVRGNPFLISETYSVAAGTNNGGTLQKWYLEQLFSECLEKEKTAGLNAYEEMMKGISEIAPGSDGLITLPYFAGERTPLNDPDARGMIVGLSLSHTKRHLYRSALEGIGYSVAQHIDIFRENGLPVKRIAAAGGGTKNAVWMQMVADIAGVSLETPKEDIGAAYGDALMAAIGVGFYQGFSDLRQVIQKKCIYKPDLERHELYKPFRKLFDELYRCNQEILHSLSKHNK